MIENQLKMNWKEAIELNFDFGGSDLKAGEIDIKKQLINAPDLCS